MIKRRCKDCGKEFTLSDSEVKFYEDRNLELPKRCAECREKNKKRKNDNSGVNMPQMRNDSERLNKGNGKEKHTFRNVVAIVLIAALAFIGKFFNIGQATSTPSNGSSVTAESSVRLSFRSDKLLDEHFEKHGSEFNYTSKEQYVDGANAVVNSSSALHKKEDEDGDDIYYDEKDNEIVFVSKDGYIRTYFKPSDGKEYFNRQ